MKIDDRILNYEISRQLPKTTQNTSEDVKEISPSNEQKVEEKDRSGQGTIVNLSPTLKEAQTVREIITSEPEIREDKVAELKEKIESGKYKVDHDAVADKLVDTFIDEIL